SHVSARLKHYLTNSARFSPHQRLVLLDKVDYSRPRQYKAQSNAYGTGPRMSANDPKRTYGTRPGHGVAYVGYSHFSDMPPAPRNNSQAPKDGCFKGFRRRKGPGPPMRQICPGTLQCSIRAIAR